MANVAVELVAVGLAVVGLAVVAVVAVDDDVADIDDDVVERVVDATANQSPASDYKVDKAAAAEPACLRRRPRSKPAFALGVRDDRGGGAGYPA